MLPAIKQISFQLQTKSTFSLRPIMSSSLPNPATLFKGPLHAIWNVQGENVPTLWWPAKSLPEEQGHTVLFMLPGMTSFLHFVQITAAYIIMLLILLFN